MTADFDSTPNINHSGGTDLNARRDINIGSDVVERGKIIRTEQIDTGGSEFVFQAQRGCQD